MSANSHKRTLGRTLKVRNFPKEVAAVVAGVTFIRCRFLLSLRPKREARSGCPVPQFNLGRPQGAEMRS